LKPSIVWPLILSVFLSFGTLSAQDGEPSWAQVYKERKGTITAIWFESRPFIYRDNDGQMKGIEHDLLENFSAFLRQKYHVDLQIKWQEGNSFSDTYAAISENDGRATFGVSAFSKTDKRDRDVDFSPTYMSDISVLITSEKIPALSNLSSLNEVLPKLTAITIKETTFEVELQRLQNEGRIPFVISYIESSENIVQAIAARDSAFGFVDLPVYMMMFNEDPSIKVKRQNLMHVKRTGYAILYPENADWRMPLEEFFSQPDFRVDLKQIIGRYIDLELYHFLEKLAGQSDDETVMLLTKEKEIQYQELLGRADIILRETRMRNFLIALTVVTLGSLIVILTLYQKRNEQKEKIEAQGQSLEAKSNELEKQNQNLITLDEEKNNLIRILAHDLRTPVNHIQGMAQLMLLDKSALSGEQHIFIEKIVDSSVRVNKMISHLLDIDALENNRVKIFLEKVDLTSLVPKVINSFEKQAAQKEITLVYESQSDHSSINGETLYLFEIFENLISNAIKFSSPGNPVSITLESESTRVRIRINDSGPGLTPEDQAKLFKKYQRLSAKPTGGEPSVGLGLSIVKKYVELMGGTVWCESETGKGATFIVEFPAIPS
jgi:signal transduction histidine kinase